MNPRLRVVVRLFLDHNLARIVIRGRVTGQSCRVLYVIAKRLSLMKPGMLLTFDLRQATVDADALQELESCSRSGHIPELIDPFGSDYKLELELA